MNNALYNSVRLLSRRYPGLQGLLEIYFEETDSREKERILKDLMESVIEVYYHNSLPTESFKQEIL